MTTDPQLRQLQHLEAVPLPEVSTAIKMPMSELRPMTFPITSRNQHVTAQIQVINDSLVVTAQCDSIPRIQNNFVLDNSAPPEKQRLSLNLAITYILIFFFISAVFIYLRKKLR